MEKNRNGKIQEVYLGDLEWANLASEDDFCRNIMGYEAW